jgi:hypothetical protein
MYVPYKTNFFDTEEIEGFYLEESIENLIPKLDITTPKTISPSLESPRFIHLAFKDSTDEYIKTFDYKFALYSRRIDLGEKFINKSPLELKNTFFEPTAQRFTNGRTRA